MSEVLYDEIDSGTIYALLLSIPEAEEMTFAWIAGDADVQDFAAVLSPEVGVRVEEWHQWTNEIQEAMLAYVDNYYKGELDLDD